MALSWRRCSVCSVKIWAAPVCRAPNQRLVIALGAAGAIEAIMTLKALQCQIAPPTLNLHRPEDAAADVDLVPLVARPRRIHVAVSNSFGFGGTNASLGFQGALERFGRCASGFVA